ncbi:MAG: hypothetical protein ACK5NG_03610 [Chthoniobacterales bacterium]
MFPLMVIVSLALHLASLVVFQIVYPPASQGAYHPASVLAVLQTTPRADVFYAWLEASDPSVFSQYQPDKRELFQLPEISFKPSFDTHRPDILVPEIQSPRVLPPERIFEFLADTESGLVRHSTNDVIPPPHPVTRVEGTGSLANIDWLQPDMTLLRRPPNEFPAPTVLDVALSPENEIRYIFLQKSSGSEALDQLARQTLLKTPVENKAQSQQPSGPLTWGSVWFLWGPDVFPQTTLPSS